MTTRQEVYAAIDGERAYQDNLPGIRTEGKPHTVGNYITMLQHYQNELVKSWAMCSGDHEALHVMRKIAGIAVHCMEDHGALERP